MKRPGFEADRFAIKLRSAARCAMWRRNGTARSQHLDVARDGRTLLATANDLGQTPLFAVDVGNGRVTRLSGAGHGRPSSRRRERGTVVVWHDLATPPDLYLLDGKGAAAAPDESQRRPCSARARSAIRAVQLQGLERRDRLRLRGQSVRIRRGPQVSDRLHRARRPAGELREPVELALERPDLRGAAATPWCSSTSTGRPATARPSRIRSASTGATGRSRICRKASPRRSESIRGSTASAPARWAPPTAASCRTGSPATGRMASAASSTTPASSTPAPCTTPPRSCGSPSGRTAGLTTRRPRSTSASTRPTT